MVGTNLKAESMKLMDKRSALEEEMNIIIQRLAAPPNGPGLSGNLLDSEGFPRADIDIPTVRADRRRLAELRNDHKDITDKINQNIQLLHSARLEQTATVRDSGATVLDANIGPSLSVTNPITARGSFNVIDMDITVSRPFAMIDEITEASPAAEDCLQLGDQIVKFANVEIGENVLQRLAAEVQKNENQAVPLVVMRQGALITLIVTPRAWSGRGLLGCHFRTL
ncbi:26S proteasome non-ATPase regulatory subunit 9-like [Dorcoceras hygrometricum]|uniref:26S proteasome non-ATPase regulatory subunit 9-like n=1 Tax=Dorcoceras hygrometricum TaxID=472368 RepID=A0A2Z7C190_9LAMI|nr:26S proteasome non-ATPase regulatory subunit 9-like [Dorcoceras hygrometricum]